MATAVVGFAAPQIATAQTVAPDHQAASELDEVIVTAQRRRERLEDVPASVTAVSGEALTAKGIVRFQDIGQSVPGLQVNITGGYTQPSIRGVSTTLAGAGAETNVGVYIDGFYQASQFSINQDLANLRSVEVLKGPQGTLYGRNATGGAILINTLDPGDDFRGNLSASFGRLEDRNIGGFVSGPIVEGLLAFSVSANEHTNDGYIKDINCFAGSSDDRDCDTAPFESRSVRTKLKLSPSAVFDLTLGYNYFSTRDARGLAFAPTRYPSAQVKAILAGAQPGAEGLRQAYQERDRTSLNFAPRSFAEGQEWTLLGRLDLGSWGSLTSRSALYREYTDTMIDQDATPIDSTTVAFHGVHKVFTQALDYSVEPTENLGVLAGVFYLRDTWNPEGFETIVSSALRITPANPGGILQRTVQYLDTPDSYSGYLDGTYRLWDRIFLTAGVRYTREEKTANLLLPNANGVLVSQRGVGQPPSTTFEATTPRAVIRYNLSEGANLYASYSQGFKSGTYNIAAGLITPVRPERVDAYEVGGKLRRNRYRLEAAAYFYDYRDLQISKVIFNSNLNTFQTAISNATDSRIYGAEVSGEFRVTDALTVSGGVNYLNARYADFRDAVGIDTRVGTDTQQNSSPTNPQDWSGLPTIRSPEFSGNVNVTYDADLAYGRIQVSGNAYATTSYAPKDNSLVRFVDAMGQTVQDTGERRYVQPGYVLVNFTATWTHPSDRYSVGAYLNNATNERYRVHYSGTAFGDYEMFNEPRTYGVRLDYRF